MDYQRRIDDRLLRRVNPASLDDPRAGATGQAGVSGIAQASTFLYLQPWYATAGWAYRARIDIPGGTVGATLSNFPVYVNGTGMPAELWSAAQASGNDLLVTKADGLTKVAHDLPHFVPGSSAMELHFLADSVPTGSASSWWLYWGNAAAADQRNAAGVWGGGLAVWHLGEASGNYADATGNGWTGTDAVDPGGKAGKLFAAGGETFDGSDDYLGLSGNIGGPGFSGLAAVTFSLWFKRTSIGAADRLLDIVDAGGNARYSVRWNTNNTIVVYGRPDNGGVNRSWTTTNAYTDTTSWHHFAVVVDIAGDDMQIYMDGAQVADNGGTGAWVPVAFDASAGASAAIGSRYDGAANWLSAIIDEARIRPAGLSGDWIAAEHANQADVTAFYTVTAAQTGNLAPTAIIGFTGHGIEGGYLV